MNMSQIDVCFTYTKRGLQNHRRVKLILSLFSGRLTITGCVSSNDDISASMCGGADAVRATTGAFIWLTHEC